MSETNPIGQRIISYGGSFSHSDRDVEHLRILSICHYIAGALTILFSSIFIFHIIMGIAFVTGKIPMTPTVSAPAQPFPPSFFGYMFIVMGSAVVLIGWTTGILMIYSGICMARRKARLFSLIIAGVSCAFAPIGTVLGVFTLIVLLRDSVRMSYAQQS